jgi:hypothetical protein
MPPSHVSAPAAVSAGGCCRGRSVLPKERVELGDGRRDALVAVVRVEVRGGFNQAKFLGLLAFLYTVSLSQKVSAWRPAITSNEGGALASMRQWWLRCRFGIPVCCNTYR